MYGNKDVTCDVGEGIVYEDWRERNNCGNNNKGFN